MVDSCLCTTRAIIIIIIIIIIINEKSLVQKLQGHVTHKKTTAMPLPWTYPRSIDSRVTTHATPDKLL